MTNGFQQQTSTGSFVMPKSALSQQNGQQSSQQLQMQTSPNRRSRSFQPKPGMKPKSPLA